MTSSSEATKRLDRTLRPSTLLLFTTLGVPLLNYVILLDSRPSAGPSGNVRIDIAAISAGWRIVLASSVGVLLGLALVRLDDQRTQRRRQSSPLMEYESSVRIAFLVLAMFLPIAILRIFQNQSESTAASSTGPLMTLLFFLAPAACSVLSALLLSREVRFLHQMTVGNGVSRSAQWLRVSMLAVGAVLPGLAYSLNRAAVALPSLAILFMLSKGGVRIGLPAKIIMLLLSAGALNLMWQARVADSPYHQEVPFSEVVQIYGASPQFVNAGAVLLEGKVTLLTPLYSAMSPVPALGAFGRQASGTTIFNQELYGSRNVRDQLLFANSELFAVGGYGLVVGTFALLAIGVSMIEGRATASLSPVASYSWSMVGFALAMAPVSSILSVAQSCIAFALPALVVGRSVEWLSSRSAATQRSKRRQYGHRAWLERTLDAS